ncbi:unnamed protein product [Agarophyton chilense]
MTTPRSKLPVYVKLNQLAPGTHGQKLIVQVVSKNTISDSLDKAGRRRCHQHVLVADETGAMLLNAHDDFCDKLLVDQVVELHNVRVKLVNDHMRLTMDKWASVHQSFRVIPQPVQTDPNFSQVLYQQLPA